VHLVGFIIRRRNPGSSYYFPPPPPPPPPHRSVVRLATVNEEIKFPKIFLKINNSQLYRNGKHNVVGYEVPRILASSHYRGENCQRANHLRYIALHYVQIIKIQTAEQTPSSSQGPTL
jgi:hypothetical protein